MKAVSGYCEGACTHDVCTGRRKGVPPKADNIDDKLREGDSEREDDGVKKSKIFADVFLIYMPPWGNCHLDLWLQTPVTVTQYGTIWLQ